MSLMHKIKASLLDATIIVSESTLSYAKCINPRSKSVKMLLLHREPPSEYVQQKAASSDELESTELDMTGSPLKYELVYPEVNETIIDQRNWKREEELQIPLDKLEACVALNRCIESLSDEECSVRLLAICNGSDSNKTVLLGSYVENGWYTTVEAHISNARQLSNIAETPAKLFTEYIDMFSVKGHEVSTSITSTYELCGKRSEVTELADLSPSCFGGNFSIEVNWNTLSFLAPIRAAKTTLVMGIIPGSSRSYLNHLWKEIALLNQYLIVLERYKPNERNSQPLPSFNSITWDEIERNLNLLLSGNIENTSNKNDDNDEQTDIHDIKLNQHIENVQHRQDKDFADMLWELLIRCADYAQVTNCFCVVLREVQSGSAAPQIRSTNSARITKIISDILNQKGAIPVLVENLSLELLIDIGLKKLSQDYTYILMSSNLVNIHNIRQTLYNIEGELFNIECCRKKLASLAQIHLCLEFTSFAQNYLHCPTADLQSIFMHAFDKYVSEKSVIKSFADLRENQIQCLNVPFPTVAVKHIVQGLPSSWCLKLSSKSSMSSITTTSWLSRMPMLPPNIYHFATITKLIISKMIGKRNRAFGLAADYHAYPALAFIQ